MNRKQKNGKQKYIIRLRGGVFFAAQWRHTPYYDKAKVFNSVTEAAQVISWHRGEYPHFLDKEYPNPQILRLSQAYEGDKMPMPTDAQADACENYLAGIGLLGGLFEHSYYCGGPEIVVITRPVRDTSTVEGMKKRGFKLYGWGGDEWRWSYVWTQQESTSEREIPNPCPICKCPPTVKNNNSPHLADERLYQYKAYCPHFARYGQGTSEALAENAAIARWNIVARESRKDRAKPSTE